MKRYNTLNEEINRMRSLFTEERMFGNLIKEQTSNNEVPTKLMNCGDVDAFDASDGTEKWKTDKFTGLVKICKNGKAIVVWLAKNGVKDGVYRRWKEKGQLSSEINYKDGKKDGVSRHWHENGQLEIESNYKYGKYDGLVRWWYENGQLEIESNYKDGDEDGVDRWWYKNGQLETEINHKDGKKDGVQITYDADGDVLRTEYYENGNEISKEEYEKQHKIDDLPSKGVEGITVTGDKPETEKEQTSNNEVPTKLMNCEEVEAFDASDSGGKWKTDKFTGLVKFCKNGKATGVLLAKNGDFEGLYRAWYENGQLKYEINYKDGEIDGVKRDWYENGQLKYEINYKYGERDGVYRDWYENGQLETESNYKDDYRDGVYRVWYENGQLKNEINYKDGERDGLYRAWHENGQLENEYNYKDGERDGLYRWWYENGQLEYEINYKDGKKDGRYIVFYINGDVEKEKYWKNGTIISKEEYEELKIDDLPSKGVEGITVTGDKPETNQNTDTSEKTEPIESEEEMDKLDKKGCITHIKDMHKKVNSSGDAPKWKLDNPKSVTTIESCLKTHYETFQKQGIFKAGDEAKKLINLLELKIDKPKETKDKNTIEIKNNRGNVVLYIKLIKGNLYRFRGKKGQVIIDSARSGGLGEVKYFNPDIEKNIMDQMKLTGKKITINKGINTKGLDMGTFTVN